MAQPPFSSEFEGNGGGRMSMVQAFRAERPDADTHLQVGRPGRELCLYPAAFGYDLQEELEFLSNRALEPNIFFSARLLAPAMPRVEDKQVRLALIRDEIGARSRMRLLMPFTVEKPGFSVGASIIRAWANPFGPVGTPLVDAEDSAETIDNLFEALSMREARLPSVLVMPDVRLSGPFAQLAKAVAIGRNLPVTVTDPYLRPMLESLLDGEAYLKHSISSHHYREMRRLWRNLGNKGSLSYSVARQPEEIRLRMEEFLALEAKGWKGRKRSALINDRYRAAFAREAITNLAEVDAVRIHTIDFDGRAIASLIVFIMAGEAYTWKTAYDEVFPVLARQAPDGEADRMASRRRQHRAHRQLRGSRSSDHEPFLGRARGDGDAGDRPAPERRPRRAPGGSPAPPLPQHPQHGPHAAREDPVARRPFGIISP